MPDAITGQYQLIDYLNELKALGFDGYSDSDLIEMINRAYFQVSRRSKWTWEKTSDVFTVAAGSGAQIPLWPIAGGSLPYIKSIDKLYITTLCYRNKMVAMTDNEFYESWLGLDFTDPANQGEPASYFILGHNLWILPAPTSTRDFVAYYTQRVGRLVGPGDMPITPPDLDEAISFAARVKAHERSKELMLAGEAQARLEDFFDDLKSAEGEIMEEQQTRVLADDQWL